MAINITTVVGARPQFIKTSLLSQELRRVGIAERLVHTGQHYDDVLSKVFFEQLGIPEPAVNLGIGSASHGRQTGAMMAALEEEFENHPPRLVIVYGDTNSTLAGALVAAKMKIPVAHIEAGMRSLNRNMPEEHNRRLTDHLSDILFCHNQSAAERLRLETIAGRIHIVGDTQRETANKFLPRALEQSEYPANLGLGQNEYVALTVHRPVNTESPEIVARMLEGTAALGRPVVFPAHPRTRKIIESGGVKLPENVRMVEPLGYLDMLALTRRAALLLTDSGGLQKEALFLGTPCVTFRGETEWTETLDCGMNILTGVRPSPEKIVQRARPMLEASEGKRAMCDTPHHKRWLDEAFGPLRVSINISEILRNFLK